MRSLIFAVLLGACHKAPPLDHGELERLKAEQRALAAKVEALQAQIDHAPPPVAVAPPPRSVAPAPAPLPRPLLTNIDTAETGAVVTTRAPAPVATQLPADSAPASPATGTLHTEDLHGAPIGGAANPPDVSSSTGISDSEGAAMLEQLQAQMKQLKSSQAAQQSALDQLEQMR